MGQNQMSPRMLDRFCFELLKVVTARSGVALPQLLLTEMESEMESGWKGKSRAALWQVERGAWGSPPYGRIIAAAILWGSSTEGVRIWNVFNDNRLQNIPSYSSDPVNKGFNRTEPLIYYLFDKYCFRYS